MTAMNPATDPMVGLMVVPSEPETETGRRQVPLTGVRVRVGLEGPAGRVRVTQSYENREKSPVEALYVFPLEEGSAVCGFAVTIDGKRLEGRVEEREEAFDTYDNAMTEGHGAFLLDQERPNVFTASVGNLMPGQKADVEIDYVSELTWEGDALRLMLPSTISPRYVSESRQDFEGQTDGDRVNPPATTDALPYPLDLEIEADLLTPVRSVESPSHKIRTEVDGACVRVVLAGDEGRLDRDFVLLLEPERPALPLSRLVRGKEGERIVMATFRPEIPERRDPVEVLFLVDCSGSMGGSSIEEARRTLGLCLHSLAPGDRFDIVRFGSSFEALFDESRPYDDANLKEADRYLERMDADLGGTEILAPLEALLARPESGPARRVVLLTDGEVMNEDEVIALARAHRASTHIFAFGIGYGASEFLVRGVARASNGAAEFVYPGERIEKKVMRHFRRLALPEASGIRLEWESLEVEDVTPMELPPLYPGECITVFARVTKGEGTGVARLTGEVDGGPLTLEAAVGALSPEAAEDDLVPVLWARHRIRDLEESDAWAGRSGSQQLERKRGKLERERKRVEKELVRLGTRYGLLSSATSYVVVQERSEEERAKERAELRRIPVALTRGWGGIERSDMLRAMAMGSGLSLTAGTGAFEAMDTTGLKGELSLAGWERAKAMGAPEASGGPMEPQVPRDPDLELLLSQSAEGFWELTRDLAKRCHGKLRRLEKAADQCGHPEGARLLATLLVIELMERRPGGVPDSWAMVLEKAQAWLERTIAGATPPKGHESWEAWAKGMV